MMDSKRSALAGIAGLALMASACGRQSQASFLEAGKVTTVYILNDDPDKRKEHDHLIVNTIADDKIGCAVFPRNWDFDAVAHSMKLAREEGRYAAFEGTGVHFIYGQNKVRTCIEMGQNSRISLGTKGLCYGR